jgi:glycosyltransferase 2 family protein
MDLANRNRSRRWLFAIPVALSAVLLYFAVRGVDWRRVGGIVASARVPMLGVCLIVAMCSYLLRATRWRVLLNAQALNTQTKVSLATVFWSNSAGYLGNNFLPGRAGEVIRSMMISSASQLTNSFVLTTALVERASDLVFLIIAASIALASIPGKPVWLTDASRTMTAVGAAAAIGLALIPKTERLAAWILQRLPVPEVLRAKLLGITGQVRLGVGTLHRPLRLAQFLTLTLAIWSVDVSSAVLLAYALHLSLSFTVGLLLITGLGLSSAIPSTPGYVGVWQFVAVSILVPFGFLKSDALAYILVLQVIGYLVIGALGLIGLWKFGFDRVRLVQ